MLNITRIARCLLVFAAAFSLAGIPAAMADPPPGKGWNKEYKGKPGKKNKGGKDKYKGGDDGAAVLVTAGITVLQARDIAMGQHLTGYKPLPPGIRKNLARGKPLPPGIAKKMAPSGMLYHLPVHPGYEWRIMGRDLVLVAIATAVIADILSDVFD